MSFLMLLLLSQVSATAGAPSNAKLHRLNIQGVEHAASCTASAKAALRADLTGPAALDGWKLIETMLCGPKSRAGKAIIASRLRHKISHTSFSTGDEKEGLRTVVASAQRVDELLAAGKAWDAALSVSGDQITLHYASDEACIQTRTLVLVNGKWWIATMGSACD